MSKNSHPGHRDSKTGEFVTKQYADKHPNTTQKESIPNPGRGDTGRANQKNDTKAPQQSSTGKKK